MKIHIPSFGELKPWFTIVGIIHSTANLVSKGINPKFTDILLPSVVITYGKTFLVTTGTEMFTIKAEEVVLYFVALILSLYVYSNKMFLTLTREVSLVSSILGTIETLRSPKATYDIVFSNALGFFISSALNKLVLRRSLRIKRTDIANLVAYSIGICSVRIINLGDCWIALFICAVPFYARFKSYLAQRRRTRKNAVKARLPILNTPLSKMPRRRASVANMLETKNKEL